MPLILGTNSIKDTGFNVANSVRMETNTYLTGSDKVTATSNKIGSFSFWIKRTGLGTNAGGIIKVYDDANTGAYIGFKDDDTFFVEETNSGGTAIVNLITNAVFRDTSAWYHFLVAYDTAQGTDTNRVKLYINGTQPSLGTATYPSQDTNLLILGSSNPKHEVGVNADGASGKYYLAQLLHVDGTALSNTDTGEFDSDSPTIWKPVDVSGTTLGNNGYFLSMEDSSNFGTATGKSFTANNLTAIDQCTDTCTNNFAVPNILLQGIDITYTQNNLQIAIGTTGQYGTQSSIGVNAGRWYCELKYIATTSAGNDRVMPGIVGNPNKLATYGVAAGGAPNQGSGYIGGGNDTTSWGYYKDGNIYNNEGTTSYGDTWTLNDIIGIYLDCEDNKLYFSKNGVVQASGTGVSITDPASTVSGNYFFGFTDTSSYGGTVQVNFGGATCYSISSSVSDDNGYGNFEYSPNITGDGSAKKFYSLNSKNLAEFG